MKQTLQPLFVVMSIPPDRSTGVPHLTPAEQRLIELLATHLTLTAIADELFVARSTAKSHSLSLYRKLDVHSRADAVQRAIELGLLDEPRTTPRTTPRSEPHGG
jgi:LuxR family maltose regulon positive regulatory protein